MIFTYSQLEEKSDRKKTSEDRMDRSKKTDSNESKSIYRIPPYYYIHVLDQNSNVTKLVPPRHYCIVENPAMVGKDGKVVLDGHGQVWLYWCMP